jgi:O-antigen ligase
MAIPLDASSTLNPPKPAHSRGLLYSLGFKCALVLVFIRFSDVHEILAYLTHSSAYLLYFFAPLALLAVIFSGGLRRVFRETPPKFWLAFVVWMFLAVPFSSWKGGSFVHGITYVKTDFIMLLVTAGLAATWTDCRKIIYTIAAASLVNIGTAIFFLKPGEERLAMDWSATIGNSNDLAAHLLLVLPFVLFIFLKPHTRPPIRFAAAAVCVFGLFQVLRTASRGALIALVLTVLFVFIRGSARQKLAIGVSSVIILVALIAFLPADTLTRLTSFSREKDVSQEGKDVNEEALESSDVRQYVLKQSIIYTFQNPVFGVGPGQFSTYEGTTQTKQGLQGKWKEAHNSYTQISSECGIPALVFYLAALFSTFGLLAKIHKNATGPYRSELITGSYCITIGLVAYSVAVFFVNFAYTFYLPSVSGLVVAMWLVVRGEGRHLESREPGTAQTSAVPLEPAVTVSGN